MAWQGVCGSVASQSHDIVDTEWHPVLLVASRLLVNVSWVGTLTLYWTARLVSCLCVLLGVGVDMSWSRGWAH